MSDNNIIINRNKCSFKVVDKPRIKRTTFWKKYNKKKWEDKSLSLMDYFLKQDSTFIDLGAWIGPYSLYASCLCSKVYSVEPDPQAFKMLSENVSLNPFMKDKIHLFNGGIGEKNGNEILYNRENSFGNSMSTMIGDTDENCNKVEVPFVTFDTFVEKQNITSCDFLKIDIEGGEYAIFKTLENFLREYKPALLISIHHFVFNDIDRTMELVEFLDKIYGGIYNVKHDKFTINKKWVDWFSQKRIVNILGKME
jgi:FkbM family methyltransferase